MENKNVCEIVDLTLLKPEAISAQYAELCKKAIAENCYSVCVPPARIKECKDLLAGSKLKIATVIAFPLGYSTVDAKCFEIKNAIALGADELDVVISVSVVIEQKWDLVREELRALRKASGDKVLKVILENCYLNQDQIKKTSIIAAEENIDFVKTSTGFGPSGAKLEDVKLMASAVKEVDEKRGTPNKTKVKAAGGIRTYEQALDFIKAGADRIGSSAVLKP
jgi:deoxyribose-phosphate aldolase